MFIPVVHGYSFGRTTKNGRPFGLLSGMHTLKSKMYQIIQRQSIELDLKIGLKWDDVDERIL